MASGRDVGLVARRVLLDVVACGHLAYEDVARVYAGPHVRALAA